MSFYVYAGNNPVNANDPTGYVRWGDALSSGLGMLSGGAGVIVGGATTLGGGALLAAPEPTFLTKVAGVGAVGFGTALVGKSSADFTLNAQNFISALRDQQPSVPSSLFELGAGLAYPGNRDAQLLAVAGNLTIDLASGRIPVGVIPDLATVGSALQSNKLASFSELTNFRAAWQGTEYLPVSVGAHGSSLITNAVDALQLSATAQTAMANYDSVLENVSSSWAGGGFLLYPNKANSNMTQSVYAK